MKCQKTDSEWLQLFDDICKQHGINVIVDPKEFEIKSPASVDVEHDEQGNLVGIGVYDGTHSLYWTNVSEKLLTLFRSLSFVVHNGKGDFECLRTWGIRLSDTQLIRDTMLIGHILDSSLKDYSLKGMAKRELGIEYPTYEDLVGKKTAKVRRTLDQWPVEIHSKYNALDCFVTRKIDERQQALCQRF